MADSVKIATADLYVGWARAFNKGDEVPYATDADKKRAEDNGWSESLASPSSKAAEAATDDVKGK